MCSECGFTRCPGGCPNAPEPEPIGACVVCGEDVFEENKGLTFFDKPVHRGCVLRAAYAGLAGEDEDIYGSQNRN